MNPFFVALYPVPGGHLELMNGIRAWLGAGGKFHGNLAWSMESWDPTSTGPPTYGTDGAHHWFDTANLDSFQSFVEGKFCWFNLNAPFYTPRLEVAYYPHAPADPLIQFVYHYPHRWGLGGGGLPAAYEALFAVAAAAGAAYVLTSDDEGHYRMHRQFVQSDGRYHFVVEPESERIGHKMLALDINPDLGGKLPADIPTLATEPMPHGYTRYWLKGHSPPEFSEHIYRLKRPGPKPL